MKIFTFKQANESRNFPSNNTCSIKEFHSGCSKKRKEYLEKTVARHCAYEGNVDSLATSLKGQLMVPSVESLLHGDALLH